MERQYNHDSPIVTSLTKEQRISSLPVLEPCKKYQPNEKPQKQKLSFMQPKKKKTKLEHTSFEARAESSQNLSSFASPQHPVLHPFTPIITEETDLRIVIAASADRHYELTLVDLKTLDVAITNEEVALINSKLKIGFHRGWLCDNIIDTYLDTLCRKNPSYYHYDCCQVISFVYRFHTYTGRRPLQNQLGMYNSIFFPLNLSANGMGGNHWTLLVCNPAEHGFQYLNPLKNVADPIPEYVIDALLTVLAPYLGCSTDQHVELDSASSYTCRKCFKPWKVTYPIEYKQPDLMSCGVFICHYVQMMITKQALTTLFDVNEYRQVMFKTILGL